MEERRKTEKPGTETAGRTEMGERQRGLERKRKRNKIRERVKGGK